MKKALKKQAAFVMLSAALAVQTGFPGYAATSAMGSWANEDGGWKFYGSGIYRLGKDGERMVLSESGGWKDGNRMAEDRQFLVLF